MRPTELVRRNMQEKKGLAMKEGTMFFDLSCGAFNIRFDDGTTHGTLKAGDSFEALEVYGNWTQARLERDAEGWYLTGTNRFADGLRVRWTEDATS